MHILHNGVITESEEIYDQIDSPQGKVLLGGRVGKNRIFESPKSHKFKIDLSAESIVFTFETIGERSVDGLKQSARKYWQRNVFSGRFLYDKAGKFLGGMVEDFATWDYGIYRSNGSPFEWGSIYTSSKGIEVKPTPSSIWMAKAKILNGQQLFDYIADYGENGFKSGDPKERFANHEISSFFESQWWTKPFADSSPDVQDYLIDNSISSEFAYEINVSGLTVIKNNDFPGQGSVRQIDVDVHDIGTILADRLRGDGNQPVNEFFQGGAGNDELIGVRGADVLSGDAGNDTVRGGNGRDVITGGADSDDLYGGFGHNTFAGEKDGAADRLFFKSDQFAENWLYGKAGNNTNGRKADIIKSLDISDRLFVQGVETSELSFSQVSNFASPTGNFSGIGIFANGFLEGLYTGGDLSAAQLKTMTVGVDA